LVPKSVTLNDLERRNGRYFALFQRIRVASGAHCVKVHVRYLVSWWVLVDVNYKIAVTYASNYIDSFIKCSDESFMLACVQSVQYQHSHMTSCHWSIVASMMSRSKSN